MGTKVISFLTLTLIMCGVCAHHYREIDQKIIEGEAYGFSIGDSKDVVFSKIATMKSQQEIEYLTIHLHDPELMQHPRPIKGIADDFSNWLNCNIYLSEEKEVGLDFEEGTLRRIWIPSEVEWNEWKVVFVWPQTSGDNKLPRIQKGMSYNDAYTTLLELTTYEAYKEMTVKPTVYRPIIIFNSEDLRRTKKWNIWYIELNPRPPAYGHNYIRLKFDNDQLIEIIRKKYFPFP